MGTMQEHQKKLQDELRQKEQQEEEVFLGDFGGLVCVSLPPSPLPLFDSRFGQNYVVVMNFLHYTNFLGCFSE